MEDRSRSDLVTALWALSLVLLVISFWKLRMLDAAVQPIIGSLSIDAATDYLPQADRVGAALGRGELPLWNPHQLLGSPLLAVPSAGVFYPVNLLYAFLPTALAIELWMVLHTLFGIAGTMLLVRQLGGSRLAGACGALVFAWCGHVVSYWMQPILLAATFWFPWTALLLLRVVEGSRRAWLALVVAVALQWLLGATEVAVHSLEAGALVACVALLRRARSDTGGALRAALWIASGVGLGTALAAVQLLPSVELVGESVRRPGALGAADVGAFGMPPFVLLDGALGARRLPSLVGLLPIVGLALGFGSRGRRAAWWMGAALTAAGALLVFGGDVFRLYAALPFGSLFRRPSKFLDVYAFGAALLAALAIEGLLRRRFDPRRRLWREPAWWAALVLAATGAAWGVWRGAAPAALVPLPALLCVFGSVRAPAARTALAVAVACAQLAVLFSSARVERRPWHEPGLYAAGADTWRFLRERVGDGRVYVSASLQWDPAFMPRQGMLQGVDVLGDYQPLSPERYAQFFESVTPGDDWPLFFGSFRIGRGTNWPMLDLLGARLVVVKDAREARRTGLQRDPRFRRLRSEPSGVEIWERSDVLPRAWRVPHAHVVGSAFEALAFVASPGFRPRELVILEEAPAAPVPAQPLRSDGSGSARVVRRSASELVVESDAREPGWLVVSELFFPGWRAWLGDRELPLLRADHLLRAVRLPAGRQQVRFVYRPTSLRVGALVSAAAAVVALGAFAATRRRPR